MDLLQIGRLAQHSSNTNGRARRQIKHRRDLEWQHQVINGPHNDSETARQYISQFRIAS